MSENLYGSLGYSWYWVLLIGLLIGATLVLGMFISQQARKRPKPVAVYINLPVTPKPQLETLKQMTLQAIAQFEKQARQKEITTREALSAYSAILREFAWRITGEDFRKLTLHEIKKTDRKHLARTIEDLYPSIFSTRERLSSQRAADLSREVIRQWTS